MGHPQTGHLRVHAKRRRSTVIFVDTNVFMYAVGREHPLRDQAQALFIAAVERRAPLVASAEVLQELLHSYLRVSRLGDLDRALQLARASLSQIWSVEADDVLLARDLVDAYPSLTARDLIHLACCRRRDVREIHTFDRGLAAAF